MKRSIDSSQGGVFATADEGAVLTVTCLAAFLFFNSFGSISVALPLIQKQFGNTLAQAQWVTLMGVVTISSLSFCFGRAGVLLGQRRLYKIGVILYATGAGMGAWSSTFVQLLVSRAVMAVGLAMALPMSTAILAGRFSSERRGQALGIFASAIAVGRMTGPAIGGLLVQLGGWKTVFWMNCIVGFFVSVAVIVTFRGTGELRREPFDWWGSVSLLLGYPALLIGLTQAANAEWTSPNVAGWFVLAIMGLTSFFWIEMRASRPLIDMHLLKRRTLARALATLILCQMIYGPIALSAPLYLQNVLNASALTAGLLLAVLPLSTALCAPICGRFADRFNTGRLAALGVVIIVTGVSSYSRLATASSVVTVVAVFVVLGAGIGLFTPANQKIAFASVSSEDYGMLSAMLSSLGTAAGTIGTTLAVALMEVPGGTNFWSEPGALVRAQQFAFTVLSVIGLVAAAVALSGRRSTRVLSS
jgi:EmrB/QacA subfamily drug resistance transporter